MGVVCFTGATNADMEPDVILEAAKGNIKSGAVVLGWGENDSLYFSSSTTSRADVLWIMERAKEALLRAANTSDGGE